MADNLEICESTETDAGAIRSLYPAAFPDEDLVPLVGELLAVPEIALSLVATIDSQIVGHVMFTRCGSAGAGVHIALLAPLAVAPAIQGQGVGTELVQAGFAHMKEEGVTFVCVLGDPAYYHRFGFKPERSVKTPYPLPEEWADAWQSVSLGSKQEPDEGVLAVPSQWQQRALWAP